LTVPETTIVIGFIAIIASFVALGPWGEVTAGDTITALCVEALVGTIVRWIRIAVITLLEPVHVPVTAGRLCLDPTTGSAAISIATIAIVTLLAALADTITANGLVRGRTGILLATPTGVGTRIGYTSNGCTKTKRKGETDHGAAPQSALGS
jgi:hypothetical protein